MNKKIILVITLIFIIISFLFVKKENFTFRIPKHGVIPDSYSITKDNIVNFKNYIRTNIFKTKNITIKKDIIEGNNRNFNFKADKGILNLKINGSLTGLNKICIDGVCLEKPHIDMLIGKRSLFLKSEKNNKYLGNFDPEHSHGQNSNIKRAVDHTHTIFNHKINNLGQFIGGKGDGERLKIEL